ncbi:MAG: hypothetical protein EOP17_02175 [Rhizobiaceae bacterium]|nr:MAG: hypothetical protein EOP17_02175 [Rhizobiaceae bacterium]
MKMRSFGGAVAIGLACLTLAGCVSETGGYSTYETVYDRGDRSDYYWRRDRVRYHGHYGRPDHWDGRPGRPGHWSGRPDRPGGWDGRPDRPGGWDGGPDRPDRPGRPDRPVRPDRPDRPTRPDRPDRPERPTRPDRDNSGNWGGDRPDRGHNVIIPRQ